MPPSFGLFDMPPRVRRAASKVIDSVRLHARTAQSQFLVVEKRQLPVGQQGLIPRLRHKPISPSSTISRTPPTGSDASCPEAWSTLYWTAQVELGALARMSAACTGWRAGTGCDAGLGGRRRASDSAPAER